VTTLADLVKHLVDAVHQLQVPASGPVCLAVSGGLDSVALTHLMCCTPWASRLHLVHVHHGLRGADADADAAFVEQLASERGLVCTVRHVDTMELAQRSKTGIEAAARLLRYDALADVAETLGSQTLVTAHTMDDQAETILMRMMRGTGIDGLRGIRRKRLVKDRIFCIRPMLDISRTQIMDTAAAQSWKWREDASNLDVYFRRNAVRHHLLPAMVDLAGKAVVRNVARLADAAVHTSTLASAYLNTLGINTTASTLATNQLRLLTDLEQQAVIRQWLQNNITINSDYTDVRRLHHALHKQPGTRIDLDGQYVVIVEREALVLAYRAMADAPASPAITIDGPGTYVANGVSLAVTTNDVSSIDANTFCLDALHVTFPLTWRQWRDGDSMQVLNGPGTQLVSDILTNAKVSHATRKHVRVVEDTQGIIWLCGIRPAHRARRTESTTSFLTLQLLPGMASPPATASIQVFDRTFRPFLSRADVDAMVSNVAHHISTDYSGLDVTLLVVLKGAMIFASDLARRLTVPCRLETIRASSYGNAMTSSGTVVVNSSLPELAGRHVIIVEDIVDSGLTIERLAADVRASGAQSVAIATLLSKPDVHKHRVALDYVGREIGSEFVVGYGLDYAEYGRELDAIWVVDDSGIDSQ